MENLGDNLKNEKVLVTGSNGFIAYHVIKKLVDIGCDVYGIGLMENQNKFVPNNKYFQVDITNLEVLKQKIDLIKPTIVIHLAAYMGRDINNIEKSVKTNVLGTLNLLKCLNKSKLKHFIGFGSGEIYSGSVPYDENTEKKHKSIYSLTKYQMVMLLKIFYSELNYPITVLRLSVVYGPKQISTMLVPNAINHLSKGEVFKMTPGEQTRDFIYVEDVAEAVLKVISFGNGDGGKSEVMGEVFNIGSGQEVKIRDIAETVLGFVGKGELDFTLPYRKTEQMRYCLDISKAKSVLEWEPKFSIKDGLSKTVKWYIKNINNGDN